MGTFLREIACDCSELGGLLYDGVAFTRAGFKVNKEPAARESLIGSTKENPARKSALAVAAAEAAAASEAAAKGPDYNEKLRALDKIGLSSAGASLLKTGYEEAASRAENAG